MADLYSWQHLSLVSHACLLLCVLQHARALEAFGRYLSHYPDMLVPLVQSSFEILQMVPLEANGQLPPPAQVSHQWKEDAVARLSMAKVGAIARSNGLCSYAQPDKQWTWMELCFYTTFIVDPLLCSLRTQGLNRLTACIMTVSDCDGMSL